MIVFVIIGFTDSLTTGVQIISFLFGGQSIGSQYHNLALNGLLNAKMRFYETNPVGRILNRMNADVSRAERNAPASFSFLFMYIISLTSCIISICVTSPWTICLFVGFGVVGRGMFKTYQCGSIECNRIEPVLFSRLTVHVDQTLEGMDTIKSYGQEELFVSRLYDLNDDYTSIFIITECTYYWLKIRAVVMTGLVTLGIALIGCFTSHSPVLGALVGVGLSAASSMNQLIIMLIINLTNMEASMNAIERLRHYAHDLPCERTEGSLHLDQDDQKWPLKGSIELDRVQVSYEQRPDHLVIKDLSLSIRSGEKIGICGRTGCGKSTLVSSLFRLIELKSGLIKIDGVDISQLDLKTLRRGLQIIPQDPILFTGTVRSNLCGSSEYGDAELWEALERVGLKGYVASLEEKLDAPIESSGFNLSFGQRQLMCLAIAFLAKPVILIMDEATASIDQESDERVQSIIKHHFQQATILSIAHRLESIADFDRILVLDQGSLVEFDTPASLLSNPQSAFSQLVEASGPETSAKIKIGNAIASILDDTTNFC